jgi:hypothetical protein
LVPRLPTPTRTVTRLRADDSVDYPCESRSSSDSLQTPNPASCRVWCLWGLKIDLLEFMKTKSLHEFVSVETHICFIDVMLEPQTPHRGFLRRTLTCAASYEVAKVGHPLRQTQDRLRRAQDRRQTPCKIKRPASKRGVYFARMWVKRCAVDR